MIPASQSTTSTPQDDVEYLTQFRASVQEALRSPPRRVSSSPAPPPSTPTPLQRSAPAAVRSSQRPPQSPRHSGAARPVDGLDSDTDAVLLAEFDSGGPALPRGISADPIGARNEAGANRNQPLRGRATPPGRREHGADARDSEPASRLGFSDRRSRRQTTSSARPTTRSSGVIRARNHIGTRNDRQVLPSRQVLPWPSSSAVGRDWRNHIIVAGQYRQMLNSPPVGLRNRRLRPQNSDGLESDTIGVLHVRHQGSPGFEVPSSSFTAAPQPTRRTRGTARQVRLNAAANLRQSDPSGRL